MKDSIQNKQRNFGRLWLLSFLAVLSLPYMSYAQTTYPWSGVLQSNRAINWSQAGVTNGIPTNRTQCGATLPATATLAQINAAIASCNNSNGYVLLSSGTYNLNGTITFNQVNNVTLRGAGANQTYLVFGAGSYSNCNGLGQMAICVINGDGGDYEGSPSNLANWTAGYAKGTASITLSSVTNLQVGSLIQLDQLDPASDTGNIWACQSTLCSQQGGGGVARAGRAETQIAIVTSISGNTVGISPGLLAPNWNAGSTPQAWWSNNLPVSGVGLENFSMDTTNYTTCTSSCGEPGDIQFHNASNGWVTGLRIVSSNNSTSAHKRIWLYQSSNMTVRSNYLYGSNDASESYGIDAGAESGNNLIENNICQHIATCTITESSSGNVFGYNYAVDNYYDNGAPNWQQQDGFHHGAGDNYNLWEGHEGIGFDADDIHGTSFMITHFRDYLSGHDPATEVGVKNQATFAYFPLAYARYNNLIGSVLGTQSYHTQYEYTPASATDPGNGSTAALSVIVMGFSDQGGNNLTGLNNDLTVPATQMLWGNYAACTGDPNCNAVRWVSSEVPSGISMYPNPVPSTQTLPPSFYLSSQPSWWPSSIPWPAVGPDVTGGNIPNVGGHANHNPAGNCYLNIMGGLTNGSSGALTFNASTCYGSNVSNTMPLNVSNTGSGFGMVFGSTSTNSNLINCGVNTGATICSTTVNSGTTVTLTATAASGSVFSGWSTAGPTSTCTGTASPCTITVSAAASLTANFTSTSSSSYTITASAGTGGTISPSGSVSVNSGASQTFTVTPNTGYTASLTVDGVVATLTNNQYTFSNVTAAHTIVASFTVPNNPLAPVFVQQAASAPKNVSSGSVSFTSNTKAGDLILVGFDFTASATVSSVTDSQGNSYVEAGSELVSPAAEHTRVYYANNIKGGADTVTVTLNGTSNFIEQYITEYSNVNTSSPIDVQAGSAGPTGAVSSGSASTGSANDIIYGFSIGDGTVTVGTGFTARSTLNSNLVEDMITSSKGSYAALATANSGWTMQMVAIKGAGGVTTTPPTPSTVTVTASAGTGGTISPSGSVSINSGASQTFTVTPNTGYTASLTLDGNAVTLTNNTYTLSNVTANHTVAASFTAPSSNVSAPVFVQQAASAPKNVSSGSVSFTSNTKAGDLILVGFDFTAGATVSSVTDSQGNSYVEAGSELVSPAAEHTRVYYANNIKGGADTVTVTLNGTSNFIEQYITEYSNVNTSSPIDVQAGSAGPTGTVTSGSAATGNANDVIYGFSIGDGTVTVGTGFTARSTLNSNLVEDMITNSKGSYAALATANSGWTMQMVAIKGAGGVTTTPPTPSTVTVTASAGTGGTISPSGSVSVNSGASQTFTVTPNTGYTASLTVDGVVATLTNNQYTFSNVTAAHTIVASFTVPNNPLAPVFVQQAASAPKNVSSGSVSFTSNTKAGDLILVGFDFTASATVSSVTDSQGNSYVEAGSELVSPAAEHTRVYYANNIKGGADTVTVTLNGTSNFIEQYITEYSNVNTSSPIDVQAGSAGPTGAVSSGSASTGSANDIIYGFSIGDGTVTVGTGFTARSTLNSNLVEDMTTSSKGSYAALATANSGWTMQMVAIEGAGGATTTPSTQTVTTSAGTVGRISSSKTVSSISRTQNKIVW